MEKMIKEYTGVILFYIFILICVLLVNARFEDLNSVKNMDTDLYAYNN